MSNSVYVHCDVCKIPVVYTMRCYRCCEWYVKELFKFVEALDDFTAFSRDVNDDHLHLLLSAISDYAQFGGPMGSSS